MKRFLSALLVVVCLSVIPSTGFLVLKIREKNETADVSSGQEMLDKLADGSVDAVQKVIDEREEQERIRIAGAARSAAVEDTLRRLQSGELSYVKAFSKVYIAGDSLMAGLSAYNVLNSQHIIAQVSASLFHLQENLQRIIALNPPILILHYGVNMIGAEEYHRDNFIKQYTGLIQQLQKALPNTRIIVSYLFPVNTSVATAPRFKYVNAYNARIKQMCAALGIEHLNSAPVFQGHPEFYGKDGIHLSATFYRDYWLPYLVRELEIVA